MKKLLTICILYLIIGKNLFAQTPHFRNYTVDDGLPSSLVYRAFQDSKGFIWFCTDKGLARFDGYKFEKFTTKNGLPNNDVWQCAEDSHQRIWFLSYANAFFYFDLKDGKFHVIKNPYRQYHDAHVWCYVEESNGLFRAILSNRKSLSINLNNKNVKVLNTSLHSNYPLTVDKEFKIYYEEKNILAKGNMSWEIRAYSESLQHNILKKKHIIPNLKIINPKFWSRVIAIEFEDKHTLYASSDSISLFKGGKFYSKILDSLSNYKKDVLLLILSTGKEERKLVITEKDIFVLNEKLERDKKLDFIKSFNINTVYYDNEDNLWLCTKNNGVFMLSKEAIDSKIYNQFNTYAVTTLTKDYLNRIWLGTFAGKIHYINTDGNIYKQKFNIEPQIAIKKLLVSNKKLLVGWAESMFSIVPISKLAQKRQVSLRELIVDTNIPVINKPNQEQSYIISGYAVKSIDFLSENRYLIGSSGNLLVFHDYPKKLIANKNIVTVKTLAAISINSKIFVGTNKGLYVLKSKNINLQNNQIKKLSTIQVEPNEKLYEIDTLKQNHPILTKPISSFTEDNQKALWTGTDGYGVYRLFQNKITQISELAGIIVNHLYFEKENNRLFVSTNEGIFVLNLKLKGVDFTYTIQRISLAQGLPTLEVNAVVVRNKELFVATSKGLAMLPLQNINENNNKNIPMPLLIKNIKINRQDTTISQLYDLNFRQNNLDIEFVALSYKSDKNIKYDYKMLSSNDNSDTIWHSVQDLHKEFSLLSPGKYEFMLRAFDIDGYPSKSTKPIIFIINPPFWQTLWFKFMVGLLLFSLILTVFYIRTRNIKKKEQEKTEVNKKFAELELQALQAQMNPHFVFNALSAIQNFILNNNTEEATDYLSRFSRLMRLFLESSRNKYIALSDEKNLLDHYIKLEELRFKDKFSSEIIVHESVSLDTEIPSMLLQPFVENAINHGLVYKEKNDGLLTIEFSRIENKLICTIEDNGIGRAKAAEIKNKSLKPYKSRSTEITEDRLRSLELIENTKIEIIISDKIDKDDMPQGTTVTIIMYL